MDFNDIKARAIAGCGASVDEAMFLATAVDADTLCDAADEIRRAHFGDVIDTCSIVNARSGRCSEDCKWCAQSRHHHTGIAEYDFIPLEDALAVAVDNTRNGVMRFSLVTSGRRVPEGQLDRFCDIYKAVAERCDIYLCASMGLLTKEQLMKLKDAGVKRYHCNLETGSDYFPALCSTHTHADKLRTIAAAREVGLEICCGGIIGMGETLRQRLQLAQEARDAGAVSIPINILQPIAGTALENTPLISEEEVIQAVALFRFIAPKCTLRFAGGRARLSQKAMERILRGGMNGALVGNMLTTVGNKIDDDRELFARTGYRGIECCRDN